LQVVKSSVIVPVQPRVFTLARIIKSSRHPELIGKAPADQDK
jgi:hypothetical protein